MVRSLIEGRKTISLSHLQTWSQATDGAPGVNNVRFFAEAAAEDGMEPKIYAYNGEPLTKGAKKPRIYSIEPNRSECWNQNFKT